MSSSCGLQPDVVALTRKVFLAVLTRILIVFLISRDALVRRSLTILRVKIQSVRRKRFRVSLIVDVVVQRIEFNFSIVLHSDSRMLLKRHGEERIHPMVWCRG